MRKLFRLTITNTIYFVSDDAGSAFDAKRAIREAADDGSAVDSMVVDAVPEGTPAADVGKEWLRAIPWFDGAGQRVRDWIAGKAR